MSIQRKYGSVPSSSTHNKWPVILNSRVHKWWYSHTMNEKEQTLILKQYGLISLLIELKSQMKTHHNSIYMKLHDWQS